MNQINRELDLRDINGRDCLASLLGLDTSPMVLWKKISTTQETERVNRLNVLASAACKRF